MSNSYYSIGLQRLKPVHTAYCGLPNLAENWSWARDVNGRDRDETETSASRDRDVDNFSRDETKMRRWYVSRPRRRHRDHNPGHRNVIKSDNELLCSHSITKIIRVSIQSFNLYLFPVLRPAPSKKFTKIE